jgi:outer membrane usher protein
MALALLAMGAPAWADMDAAKAFLDAEIGALKLEVVVPFRSGLAVEFPVRHSRGATLSVYLVNGDALPLGTVVQVLGKAGIYPVGYAAEVYLTGLAALNRVRASWNVAGSVTVTRHCEFDVAFVAGSDPLPDLGAFICTEVTP